MYTLHRNTTPSTPKRHIKKISFVQDTTISDDSVQIVEGESDSEHTSLSGFIVDDNDPIEVESDNSLPSPQ